MPEGSLRVEIRFGSRGTRDHHFSAPEVYNRPLIPMVAALAVGIFLGGRWPGHFFEAMGTAICLFAVLLYKGYRNRSATLSPLILLALMGYILISPWLPVAFPENHISHYTTSQRWRIEGTVVEVLPERHGRRRLILKVSHLHDQHQTLTVTGCIRLTMAGDASEIFPGTTLAFRSRIKAFRNFNNPGGFDYQRHMTFKRVFGSAFVRGEHLRILAREGPPVSSLVSRYRSRLRTVIETLSDVPTQAVMKALLIGERQAISPDLRQTFNRCGVGHLLAISGLHIGIVGGLVFWLCHQGLNRFFLILERGWGRRGATALAIGPIVAYAILSGLSPATQRALIMVLAFLVTYFIHKDGDTLNFLALAALLMLVWHPPALFSISFQMSFGAVFWIVLGLKSIENQATSRPDWPSRMWNRIKTFVRVTLWATAGTLPLVMYYFQQISLVGLIANCLLVPLMGFFILPLGILSLLVLPVNTYLAETGIQLAGWGLDQALRIMQMLAAFDGAAIPTVVPSVIEIICYYALLGMVAMRNRARLRRWVWLIVLMVLVVDGLYWGHARFWHRDLRVTIMDVGQGSAALVEFPGGETMLIDGGGYSNNQFFDMGERIIAPFLRSRKIMQVDTLVLSHPSSDHMNGLIYILGHFHPKRLLWTGARASTDSFRDFFEAVLRSGVNVPAFFKLDRNRIIGGVAMDILHPPPTACKKHHPSAGDVYNNHSLVVKLTMGACSILFPGDIEAWAESELLECCRSALPSRVLVAPHHGSQTSSSMGFLSAVHPEIVVISAGWQNRFGFPHTSVIERYEELAARIYRTDHNGAVGLRTDGQRWEVRTR
jgi:competence protein ComEC